MFSSAPSFDGSWLQVSKLIPLNSILFVSLMLAHAAVVKGSTKSRTLIKDAVYVEKPYPKFLFFIYRHKDPFSLIPSEKPPVI